MVVVTESPLPSSLAGVSYRQELTAYPAVRVDWSIVRGWAIPSGLDLEPESGVLAGLPVAGEYAFVVQARDRHGSRARKYFELRVEGATGLTICASGASLPAAVLRVPYCRTLAVSGGSPPYVWSVVDDEGLSPDLQLNPNSGVISGLPTVSGGFPCRFRVRVRDSAGANFEKDFLIGIRLEDGGFRPPAKIRLPPARPPRPGGFDHRPP